LSIAIGFGFGSEAMKHQLDHGDIDHALSARAPEVTVGAIQRLKLEEFQTISPRINAGKELGR
jgi:hypothetical protein